MLHALTTFRGSLMTIPRDPWAFQRWAYQTTTGNPVRKSVLMVLAVMAEKATGRCEGRQDSLAQWVEVDETTIRRHLRQLEELGVLARRHQYRANGRRGCDEFLLLAPWVEEWPDGQSLPGRAPGSATGQSAPSLPGAEPVTTVHQHPVVKVERPLKNDRLGTDPPLPPQGGDPEIGSHLEGEQLERAVELWQEIVTSTGQMIEEAGQEPTIPIMHLRGLEPVAHDDGHLALTGGMATYCHTRFGDLVNATASELGTVVEFRPPERARSPRRRPRGQERRAA